MVEKQFSKSIKVFQSDGGGEFSSIVGSLQYLTLTRPDITHAVNLASQFMQNPNSVHFQAVKRILRYTVWLLRCRLGRVCNNKKDPPLATAYMLVQIVYPGPLGSKTRARSSAEAVARSSAEAEYRALAATAGELTWITYILQDIGIYLKSAPTLSKKPKHICRIKHGSKKTYRIIKTDLTTEF
ncbi:uncharacterized mitochondrial protein AtMg00810-like [Lycium ferocissimum]|uniref:uncharacterized mitochondrial protein AtMg00810-like n=1 Tax=Lycium ferocissimum TaxID=112874 RepID=UPI00281621C1|nr:uncharacterized mitochondrial protein AtMg00810-like [Lycium ferocissimum]